MDGNHGERLKNPGRADLLIVSLWEGARDALGPAGWKE